MPDTPPSLCPCGAGAPYAQCCGRFLDGAHLPQDAETLMRSRYSAFVLHRRDYLLATWHPRTRPDSLNLEETPQPRWLGLHIKKHATFPPHAASVEFAARYKIGGRAFRMHEVSQFVREDGRWFYVEGVQRE